MMKAECDGGGRSSRLCVCVCVCVCVRVPVYVRTAHMYVVHQWVFTCL
jgi:hypothetical protein